MALSIPKVGFARLLKEGAKHFQGVEESVIRNIEACTELAAQVRSAYGPNGMNKMVINHIQKLFVTNDAATILNELEVEHPAAKLLVLASKMQQQEVGDGTNAVIIFGCSLLEHAAELLKMGLNPTEIAEGYDLAAEKALEILPNLVCHKVEDIRNIQNAAAAIRPSIMSKQYGHEDFLADLIARACVQILPKNEKNFNVDNIRVCKILGSGVSSSRLMNGMVFKRGAEGEIKKATDSKIAVFTCAFDVTQTETKGTILMHTADELLTYSKGEEDEVENQVKALSDAGVGTVVAGGKFGELYTHFLNKYGIMGVRLNSKFDLRRLCRAVGAQAQTRIISLSPNLLGHCDEIYVDEVGDTEVTVFKQKQEHGQIGIIPKLRHTVSQVGGHDDPIATVVIRGSSENLLDDIERCINNAINCFKIFTRDDRMVAGAGAVEIELARQIESFGEKCPGLEQYAIQKFALSLEALPKQLADNAGVKATEVLSKLYAEHQQGNSKAGFDCQIDGGGVVDAVTAGILDPYLLKHWLIKLATNAATTILRVDQIIMSKPSGGAKPKGPRGQDEDED